MLLQVRAESFEFPRVLHCTFGERWRIDFCSYCKVSYKSQAQAEFLILLFDHTTLNISSFSPFLLRVHGAKVAEVPLVGTRFKFRRLGMCRILIEELEKVIFFLWIWGEGKGWYRNVKLIFHHSSSTEALKVMWLMF